jgi:protein SCO1/2
MVSQAQSASFGVLHDGRVIAQDLPGWRLIYFGYTMCPDVCPTSLITLADVIEKMGPAGERLTPAFVTVDPERDTPDVMKNYVSAFHPRLVGLTPTEAALQGYVAAYRIKYLKVERGPGQPYLMDHSSSLYLIAPDNKLAGKFPHNFDPAKIAEKIVATMARVAGQP